MQNTGPWRHAECAMHETKLKRLRKIFFRIQPNLHLMVTCWDSGLTACGAVKTPNCLHHYRNLPSSRLPCCAKDFPAEQPHVLLLQIKPSNLVSGAVAPIISMCRVMECFQCCTVRGAVWSWRHWRKLQIYTGTERMRLYLRMRKRTFSLKVVNANKCKIYETPIGWTLLQARLQMNRGARHWQFSSTWCGILAWFLIRFTPSLSLL